MIVVMTALWEVCKGFQSQQNGANKTTFLKPSVSFLKDSLDFRDKLQLGSVSDVYGLQILSKVEDLRFLLVYKNLSSIPAQESLSLNLDKKPYFAPASTELAYTYYIMVEGFNNLPQRGVYNEYCLLSWVHIENSTLPDLDPSFCVWVYLMAVDTSLDHRNISEQVYNRKLNMVLSPHATKVSMWALTKGLLPEYNDYKLNCRTFGQSIPPTLSKSKDSATKFELSPSSSLKNFSYESQTVLEGYIIDYSVTKGAFKVYRADAASEFVGGFFTQHPCQNVTFMVNNKERLVICVVCQTPDRLEVVQLTLIEILEHKHNFSEELALESGWSPTKAGSKTTYTKLQTIFQKQEVFVPGLFRDCGAVDVNQMLYCKIGSNDSITSAIVFDRQYEVMKVNFSPLEVIRIDNFTLSKFESYFSAASNKTLSEPKLELIGFPTTNKAVLTHTDQDGRRTVVVFTGLNIITQDPYKQFISEQSIDILYSTVSGSQSKTLFFLLKDSLVMLDNSTKTVFVYTNYQEPRRTVRNFSTIDGVLKYIRPFPSSNKLLVDFALQTEYHTVSSFVMTVLLDCAPIKMPIVERLSASVTYTSALNLAAPHLALSFYDAWNDELVWFSAPDVDSRSAFRTDQQGLKRLSLKTNQYHFTSESPGTFDCLLTNVGKDTNFSVQVDVDVLAYPQLKYTPIKEPKLHFDHPGMLITTTIDLEEYYQIDGPVVNGYPHFDLAFCQDISHDQENCTMRVGLDLRTSLFASVEQPYSQTAYERLLLIDNTTVIGVERSKIYILRRELGSQHYKLFHELDYLKDLTVIPSGIDCTSKFERFEFLDYLRDRKKPELLHLVGVTNKLALVSRNEGFGTQSSFVRMLIWICLDLSDESNNFATAIHFEAKATSDPISIGKFWQATNSSSSGTWLHVGLILHYENPDSPFELLVYDLDLVSKYSHNIHRDDYLSQLLIADSLPIFFDIILDRASAAEPQIIYLVRQGGDIAIIQKEVPTYKPNSVDIIPFYSIPGRITAANCSISWKKCIFALDTNILIHAAYEYDANSNKWKVEVDHEQWERTPRFLAGSPVKSIIFGKEHFLLHSEEQGTGIHVYKQNKSLDYPYAILSEYYSDESIVSFGTVCEEMQNTTDFVCKEVIVQGQNSSAASVFEITTLRLILEDIPSSQLTKLVSGYVSINKPQQSEEKLPPTLFGKLQLTLSSRTSQFVPADRETVILYSLVLIVLVGLLGCGGILNLAYYRLRTSHFGN